MIAQIFHDFFYQEGEAETGRASVRYEDRNFFSYNTQIGRKYVDDNGQHWLFVADSNFSATTCQHRGKLISSCPYGDKWIVRVPFDWDDDFCESQYNKKRGTDKDFIRVMRKRFEQQITRYKKDYEKTAEPDTKRALLDIVQRYREFMHAVDLKPTAEFGKKLEAIDEALKPSPAAVARRKAYLKKIRDQKKAELERKRKEVEGTLKKYDFMTLITNAFCWGLVDSKESNACKNALDALWPHVGCWDGPAFVMPKRDAEESLYTTKGVTFPAKLAWLYMKRWRRGDVLEPGTKIGTYELRSLTKDFVQIGCHRIPMRNIEELYTLLEEKYGKGSEPVCAG